MTENTNSGYLQKDSTKHEVYAKAWHVNSDKSYNPTSVNGIYIGVRSKSWEKFKSKLKDLSSRRSVHSIKPGLEKIKMYAIGRLNYYGIASRKNNIDEINGWLYPRIHVYIWKQWKKPKTKVAI